MAQGGKLRWNDREFRAALNRHLHKNLTAAAIIVQRAAKANTSGRGGGPKRRTGTLRHSIAYEVNGRKLTARVGSNLKYARIQEKGGAVSAKNAKYLTIPVSDQAKKAGSPLHMGDLDFIPRPGGNPLLVSLDENDEMTVHYVLKKSVVIPPHPYLRPALDRNRGRVRRALTRRMPRR